MDKPRNAIRLPRTFDAARLQADLAATVHYGTVTQYGNYHRGDWTGLSLRSEGGDAWTTQTGLVPTNKPFQYTAVVEHTPYLREVLESFACPQRSVRLLHLRAGGRIETHTDGPLTFQHGILRLHIPIVTHPEVEFVIDGERCRWQAGELWWGNFARPHHVYNHSPIDRVHLVMDVEINDYVLELFPREFRDAQSRDGILFHRDRFRLTPRELARFECEVAIEAGRVPHDALSHGCRAKFALVDGQLAMLVDGAIVFRLDPLAPDEFAIVGWSHAVTLRFARGAAGVTGVSLIVRGLPRDMLAPSSAENPVLAVNELPFPVL